MKKFLIFIFVFIFVLSISFVLAGNTSLIVKSGSEERVVKLVAANDDSATISVDGDGKEINEGTRTSFQGVVVEVEQSDEQDFNIKTTAFIGVEIILNSTKTQDIVYFDNVEYKAELVSASNSASTIKINGIAKESIEGIKREFGNSILVEVVDSKESNFTFSSNLIVFLKKEFSFQEINSRNETVNVKEQVKCVFTGSGTEQRCYTDDGKFRCEGKETCVVDVSGEKGSELAWKSSCGGYIYTTVDGDDEYAEFSCYGKNETQDNNMDSCLLNPNNYWDQETDKCYLGYSDNARKNRCSDPDGGQNIFRQAHTFGFRAVYADEKDKRIRTGGKDGCVEDNTLVENYCDNNGFIQTTSIKCSNNCIEGVCTDEEKNGFRQAYIECYDGTKTETGGESICLPAILMKDKARSFCEDRCSEKTGKCGVNSLSVSIECYYEGRELVFKEKKGEGDKKKIESPEIIGGVSLCKNSCPLDDKCYPFGYRKGEDYCSDRGAFVGQLEANAQCENNFECGSNVCISGQCVDQGLLNKIISWFKKLFGSE